MKHDWKKTEKKFYLPKSVPELINVPPFNFFSIRGQGNPNDEFFGNYITALYSLSYAIKMSPKNGTAPDDYFEYTVYPLEGVWDISEEAKKLNSEKLNKNSLVFNLMIRQPEFVTPEFAKDVIERTKKKKPQPLLEQVKFETIEEKDCVQMMHTGHYDNEPESFRMMEEFCIRNSFLRKSKVHREIYISDSRKVAPDKLKTVLRILITPGK